MAPPVLSVIVVFHNMQREAERTLHALTTDYQRGITEQEYEVICLDSSSSAALNKDWIKRLQGNFVYHQINSTDRTPIEALNHGLSVARGRYTTCMIDGARIPTPNMLRLSLHAQRAFHSAYVMSIGMHLGPKIQNVSMTEGYNQTVEDRLLSTVDWKENGYELFRVSVLAGSSQGGFAKPIAESNCFTAPTATLRDIGGFDNRFKTPGGGLVNLHMHNRLIEHPQLQPIMLLGEATFHQFHGGVATNTPKAESPFQMFCDEYETIFKQPFSPRWQQPLYFGTVPEEAKPYIL